MEDLLVPFASTAAGSAVVLWLTKILLSNWLTKQEQAHTILRDLEKTMEVALYRLERLEHDLNGLGMSVRGKLERLEAKNFDL